MRIVLETKDSKEIAEKIKKYDSKQIEYINISQKDSKKITEEMEIIIKIKIPGMLNSLRIIDLPGISCSWALEKLKVVCSSEMAHSIYFKRLHDLRKFRKMSINSLNFSKIFAQMHIKHYQWLPPIKTSYFR